MQNPVVFESIDLSLPLPSPAYLELHAACCRVAHLSGAAEYIESIWSDMEDTQVLAADGSSATLIKALSQISVH